jgi:hypothetical protein
MQASPEFTFFWGSASPFSQWHRSAFQIIEPWTRHQPRRLLTFANAEQSMMAAKARKARVGVVGLCTEADDV